MAHQIQDVMTKHVHKVDRNASLREVARIMKDECISDVLVTESNGRLCGIVTDRDVVVRAVAGGRDVDTTHAGDICSDQVVELDAQSTVEDAVRIMRERAVRRVPVVKNGVAIGIVSIGDLARVLDPSSALAAISDAPPSA